MKHTEEEERFGPLCLCLKTEEDDGMVGKLLLTSSCIESFLVYGLWMKMSDDE